MGAVLVVNNESGHPLSPEQERVLDQVARLVLQTEGVVADVEISLSLVDDETMRRLNADYRGIDESTDVLSFPLLDDEELGQLRGGNIPTRPVLAGDVLVSVPTALEQAATYGHPFERELAFLFVHGLLHLFGYDHDEEPARRRMRLAEESILAAAGMTRDDG